MSFFSFDEPFSSSILQERARIQSVPNALEATTGLSELWTLRRLGMRMAIGGLHLCLVRSATQIADVFEEWVDEADCDGFSVA